MVNLVIVWLYNIVQQEPQKNLEYHFINSQVIYNINGINKKDQQDQYIRFLLSTNIFIDWYLQKLVFQTLVCASTL